MIHMLLVMVHTLQQSGNTSETAIPLLGCQQATSPATSDPSSSCSKYCPLLQVADIRSDAQFILLVEKDAAFMRLAEDRFYNTYPCIILTAKGQPDVATR